VQINNNRGNQNNFQYSNIPENPNKDSSKKTTLILISVFSFLILVALAVVIYFIASKQETKIINSEKPGDIKTTEQTKTEPKTEQKTETPKSEQSLKMEIKGTVISWLECWQNKDLNCYASHLTSDYMFESSTSRDKNQDYDTRLNKQRQYFRERDYIVITYNNMVVFILSDDKAKVTYDQSYYSPQFSDNGFKVIYLRKIGDQWKIYRDTFH